MRHHIITTICITLILLFHNSICAQTIGPKVQNLSPNGSINLPKGGSQPVTPSGNQLNATVTPSTAASMQNMNSRFAQWFNQMSTSAELASKKKPWLLSGNITTGTEFLGTINNQSLVFKANNQLAGKIDLPLSNTFWGMETGKSIISGNNNTGAGFQALTFNTIGGNNTATGYHSLRMNTSGNSNTANGWAALALNTTGNGNTAVGQSSLYGNTSGRLNTATGSSALLRNSIGNYNTGNGQEAMNTNIAGSNGTAIGARAMVHANNRESAFTIYNVAVGYEALAGSPDTSSNTGNYNTSVGYQSLRSTSTGGQNTANGHAALTANSTGNNNTASGSKALFANTTGNNNTAIGQGALVTNTSGQSNTSVGNNAGSAITTGSNNIAIGYDAAVPSPTGNNQVRIGNTNITYAGIEVPWTVTSDQRWKSDIRSSDLGLDFVKKLNPVSYTRKNDDSGKREYGFLGQDLEAALIASGTDNSGMIFIDENGKYAVRYNDLLAPMVKAVQEQQAIIASQGETINSMDRQLVDQQKQIESLLSMMNEMRTEIKKQN